MHVDDQRMLRRALLSVLLATLTLTAGCAGILSDAGGDGETTTPTGTAQSGQLTPVNGTDIRSITIPENGSATASGELDGSDPVVNHTVYEPVRFTADAGTQLNVTMQTEGGAPMLRLLGPNETVRNTTSADESGTVQFTRITLNETGQYTLEATSVEPNTTFEYTLTVERHETELFSGPLSSYNETERYLEFGQDFARAANATARYGKFTNLVRKETLRANATGDYVVMSYLMDPNLNGSQLIEIDSAILLTYSNLAESYRNLSDDPDTAEGEAWIPEVIFFRAVNAEGEIIRTDFVTAEWAREYDTVDEDGDQYFSRYLSTNRYGPANTAYNSSGGDYSTTQAEFPLETYEDYEFDNGTTFEERYG